MRVWVLAVIRRVPPLLGFYLKWVMFSFWSLDLVILLGVFFLVSGVSVLGYVGKGVLVLVDRGGLLGCYATLVHVS